MKYNQIIFLLFGIIFIGLTGLCRGQSINITVRDNKEMPLAGAIVQLTSISVSERLLRSTDLSGVARFEGLNEGIYVINISFVGFRLLKDSVEIYSGHQELEFRMTADAILMNEVVVVASRPFIRQDDDKMIIDVESVASIGTNTLEILESAPGLLVDHEGGIYLNSATPAIVFINGREQKMSNNDIMTILRSLPPGSVEHIEVIRTPSARYSASTSGGIVNVVLKRGVKIGRFGSIRAGMTQGVYGNRYTGFSLNNSSEFSTSYINFEYSYNGMLGELNSARLLKSDTSLFQSAETKQYEHQGYIGYGTSFDAGEKLNFNYDGRISRNIPKTTSQSSNVIRTHSESIISETANTITNNTSFISVRQELGMVYRIDTAGSEWDTRLSYTFTRNDGTQNYQNGFIYPPAKNILGGGNNEHRNHFIQLQSDIVYQLPLKIKMEAGLNSTWQSFNSQSVYSITIDEVESDDPLRTRSYSYLERINSGYLQAARNLGWKILLKTGIRMEHTFMKGIQSVPSDTSFVVKRPDLFPYLYLSRPLFSLAGFDLRAYAIYRKTILRPGYESLNPSIKYIDQFYYETGNPGLKPQFTNNFEVNISFDDMPVFAVGQNYTRDIFSSVIYKDNIRDNIVCRTFDNLGKNRETYFRIIGGIPPKNRYFFYAGAQYNLNDYDGVYEGQNLVFRRGSWRFFTYHSLRLRSQTRITLNGLIVTKGQMNFYELDTFGQLNLGLKQTFFSNKLSITFNARDILRTMGNKFRFSQGSINAYGDRYSDARRFGVNIIYNFGIPDRHEKEKKFIFETGE